MQWTMHHYPANGSFLFEIEAVSQWGLDMVLNGIQCLEMVTSFTHYFYPAFFNDLLINSKSGMSKVRSGVWTSLIEAFLCPTGFQLLSSGKVSLLERWPT